MYQNLKYLIKYSVHLYVYLPPYLRKEAYNKLTSRWGSHDDILAMLAPFAFRNTKYFKMGKNLLDTSVSDSTYFSVNIDQIEAIPTYQKKAERLTDARNLLRLKLLFIVEQLQQRLRRFIDDSIVIDIFTDLKANKWHIGEWLTLCYREQFSFRVKRRVIGRFLHCLFK